MTEDTKTEETTSQDAWGEVGAQFQALGESLATTFRTFWEREETREHLQSVKDGLQTMADEVSQAIDEASTSPEAQKAREEVKKAAESARVAGEKAVQDIQPHLLSALTQVNAELQRVIERMQAGKEEAEEEEEAAE